jgi:hypothetical protein
LRGIQVFILDSLLVGGLRFVLDKLIIAAEHEANDDTALRERLLDAQMRLEFGDLDESEYADIEREVLGLMRQMKKNPGPGLDLGSDNVKVTGVEATVAEEVDS